jgi:hypothetical protein
MARLIVLILGAALISGIAYVSLKKTVEINTVSPATDPTEPRLAKPVNTNASAPKQQTEYFQQKARAIEQDTQKRVDDLYKRAQ